MGDWSNILGGTVIFWSLLWSPGNIMVKTRLKVNGYKWISNFPKIWTSHFRYQIQVTTGYKNVKWSSVNMLCFDKPDWQTAKKLSNWFVKKKKNQFQPREMGYIFIFFFLVHIRTIKTLFLLTCIFTVFFFV